MKDTWMAPYEGDTAGIMFSLGFIATMTFCCSTYLKVEKSGKFKFWLKYFFKTRLRY